MKRRIGLKSKVGLKRRTRLKPVSKSMQRRLKEYKQTDPLTGEMATCVCCGRSNVEKHHPRGRAGVYLNQWVWICSKLHAWIHNNKNDARALGWLQPEYFGHLPDPSVPQPWLHVTVEKNICDS